jgi:hypothetical protein
LSQVSLNYIEYRCLHHHKPEPGMQGVCSDSF